MKSKITILTLATITGILCSQDAFSGDQSAPDADGIFWGAETNGVKTGLQIQYGLNPSNLTAITCYPYLKNSKTNNANWNSIHLRLWLPPSEDSYQMSLLDEKEKTVVKTTKGQELGKPIDQPLMVRVGGINFRAGYQALYPDLNDGAHARPFILQDYFKIKEAGKYHLKFEIRVIWLQPGRGHDPNLYTTNLPVVNLPPVEAEFQIRPEDIAPTNSLTK
jgi:hypothetical protein